MNAQEFLISLSPELQKKVKTAQYAFAKELVQLRVAMMLSQQELSDMIGVPHDKLVELEFASTDYPIGEYRDILALVQEALDKKRKELYTTDHEEHLISTIFPGADLPFYGHDLEAMNVEDAKSSLDEGVLVGIVSEQKGGIIGYVTQDVSDYILMALNLHAVKRSGRYKDDR